MTPAPFRRIRYPRGTRSSKIPPVSGLGDGADSILTDAAAKAGLDDFGETWFLGPLSAYATDLQQHNLTDAARQFLRSRAVHDLVRRLRVLDTLRQHPEIAAVPIPSIVYITGLERSGTTLLHNLLALHRDARALRRWELVDPVPPPETATHETDPRIARVQRQVDMLRGTLLEHMHWVNAMDPEECVSGFIESVSMLAWAAGPCMPTWWRFLTAADLRPAFESYRRVVQLLLWKHPIAPGGFLVLKAPQIAHQVAQFGDVFPEARFVFTDRDPYRCTVSLAALGHGIAEWFCERNPLTDDGHRSKLTSNQVRSKLSSVAAFTTSEPFRAMHVAYPDLVGAPVEVVRDVLSVSTADDQLPAKVGAYLDRQRTGARAAPPAVLDSMGYDQASVWGDPVIKTYCDRFDIEPEHTRLTGAAPTR
jgi:Sulfotransferase family